LVFLPQDVAGVNTKSDQFASNFEIGKETDNRWQALLPPVIEALIFFSW
jgi:hypothetical protein